MTDELHRWLVIARHPEHEGTVTFDLEPQRPGAAKSREQALRHAIVSALHYFRDDEFEITDPVELPLAHTQEQVDEVLHVLMDNEVTFHESSTALRRSIA